MANFMSHPHILDKTFVQITDTTRAVLERIYSRPSLSVEVAWAAFDRARGVMDLWAELTFDMGASQLITEAAQNDLEQIVRDSDTAELARWDLPPREH